MSINALMIVQRQKGLPGYRNFFGGKFNILSKRSTGSYMVENDAKMDDN